MMVYKFMILLLKYWIYILVIYIVIVFLIHGIRRCVYTRLNKLKRSYELHIAMEKTRKRTKVLCKTFFFFKFCKKPKHLHILAFSFLMGIIQSINLFIYQDPNDRPYLIT